MGINTLEVVRYSDITVKVTATSSWDRRVCYFCYFYQIDIVCCVGSRKYYNTSLKLHTKIHQSITISLILMKCFHFHIVIYNQNLIINKNGRIWNSVKKTTTYHCWHWCTEFLSKLLQEFCAFKINIGAGRRFLDSYLLFKNSSYLLYSTLKCNCLLNSDKCFWECTVYLFT